ncbi:MAG: peptidoglycan bridge formation glycyltransferase FemA/FemB family protein [Chloroflexi bacterium]|nr:MAG: peptidoglycan bridge formation glycyltransferase FemA/FemB family protein [Chloroflexota bacterium]
MTLSISQPEWQQISANGHFLQSYNWGQLKSFFGWTPVRVRTEGAAAQILFKRLPLGFTIAYIPKGPWVNWHSIEECQTLFNVIHAEARKRRAVFLKIEPHLWLAGCAPKGQPAVRPDAFAGTLHLLGFIPADTIQPQSSIIVDISSTEEAVLAAMKQKTRYNIRLARRKGVVVRHGGEADAGLFFELARQTATRDGFGIHSLKYYQTALRLFAPHHGALLVAEFKAEPLAALVVFKHGQDAFYFYGASSNSHRNLMAPYLLQWEAIRWAKQHGCARYDLWGVPNAEPDVLEAEFTSRSDGLWGVYRFKRGFGGNLVKSVGAFDFVYNPLLYKLYRLRRNI